MRSLRSEFDYGSKRKFVDVLGNTTTNSTLNRLRREHDLAKQGLGPEISYKSASTTKSKDSKLSKASLARLREMRNAR